MPDEHSADTADIKFREELGGFFYDAMKASGATMVANASPERIREAGARMAQAVEKAARRKAIEVVKILQTEVVKAFEAYEAELDKHRQEIDLLRKAALKDGE
jgi:hypothetical protein